MGFISTGYGYKRQKRDDLYCLKPKAVPRVPKSPTSQVLPSPDATPPIYGISSRKMIQIPTLESLPVDILLLIYCYVGVGTANNLPLINKHLFLVFPLVEEKWWLDTMIRYNFLVDLNTEVSFRWHRKFHRRYLKLPESVRESWDGSTFLSLPRLLGQYRHCLDIQLFHYKFVSAEKVKSIGDKFGCIVLDRESIGRERALRDKFLLWKYIVLTKIVQTYLECEDSEAPLEMNEVQRKAEDNVEVVLFRDKHGLNGYVPHTNSIPIPLLMYNRLNPKKLDTIFELNEQFGMAFTKVGELASAIVAATPPERATKYLSRLSSHVPLKYSYDEVVSLLRTLVNCREHILRYSMEYRASSPYALLVDQVFMLVEDALTKYYAHEQKDDEMIWQLLRQLEIPELLDLVIALGGSPALEGA